MNNVFWFTIIKQWREKGMGENGVTLPFLVGALTRQGNEFPIEQSVESVLNAIIFHPVPDHYCEVRWCHQIDEPVISVEKIETMSQKAIKEKYTDNSGHPSLAFTEDLMNQFGLNCSTKEECLTKLISRTQMHTEKGEFSKNNGSFGDFTDDELEFLDRISVTASDE